MDILPPSQPPRHDLIRPPGQPPRHDLIRPPSDIPLSERVFDADAQFLVDHVNAARMQNVEPPTRNVNTSLRHH